MPLDAVLGSGRCRAASSSPDREGLYGTKRYGTVRSPMTEWHGSSLASFPLFSHLRVVHVRRVRACVRARARLQVPCEPAGVYCSIRNPPWWMFQSDDTFINSRCFDDNAFPLSLSLSLSLSLFLSIEGSCSSPRHDDRH